MIRVPMTKPYQRALFIFRRDLRLADNTALARIAELAEEVVPCFVFDPRQADPEENPYFSAPAFEFMLESLGDLDRQLREAGGRLYLYRIDLSAIISKWIGETENGAVAVNRDYTPFARERDAEIEELCASRGIAFVQEHDALLVPPDRLRTGQGTTYKVFTPFWRAARKEIVPRPHGVPRTSWVTEDDPQALSLEEAWELLPRQTPDLWVRGGRARGLAILDRLGTFDAYAETRDRLAEEDGTTGLSAHHKFGTVSIRETYHRAVAALGEEHELVRQLWWRDFFTQIAWHDPAVFGRSFRRSCDRIVWENDEALFAAWCAGRTGFPIVDAGMRQLAATGWMHNRARMITASFLVKDLHVDWRRGERWFANHLVDYDPAVNNGSWQWAASTGADAQPWFRVFNPWRQQKKFDPGGEYVRRWVPELAGLDGTLILALESKRPAGLSREEYPDPVVDHRARAERAKELFREVQE